MTKLDKKTRMRPYEIALEVINIFLVLSVAALGFLILYGMLTGGV